jgi:hypothetical protein
MAITSRMPPTSASAASTVRTLDRTDRRAQFTLGSRLPRNEKTISRIICPVSVISPMSSRTESTTSRASCMVRARRQCRMIGPRSIPTDGATDLAEAISSRMTAAAYAASR